MLLSEAYARKSARFEGLAAVTAPNDSQRCFLSV